MKDFLVHGFYEVRIHVDLCKVNVKFGLEELGKTAEEF